MPKNAKSTAEGNTPSDKEMWEALGFSSKPSWWRKPLNQLKGSARHDFEEVFARRLQGFLKEERSRDELMQEFALDPRNFDRALRMLYESSYVKITPRRLHGLADELRTKFHVPFTVVAGANREGFYNVGAEILIQRMWAIGRSKTPRPVNLGVVSGRTVGGTTTAAVNLNWDQWALDLQHFPGARVYPLNVTLTTPDFLDGNAILLAYQLAKKIRETTTKEALSYGLSAQPVVEREKLAAIDSQPQVLDVLMHTEPKRVEAKLKELKNSGSEKLKDLEFDVDKIDETTTELDIVLTGIGGKLPSEEGADKSGSIFYSLSREFNISMKNLIERERAVGDLAFAPITADGTPVYLTKRESPEQYVFYSAVQLPVLQAMAKNPQKAVILVARHSSTKEDKVPAIYAALTAGYASEIVCDEEIAERLRHS
jgi:hypothetical protein